MNNERTVHVLVGDVAGRRSLERLLDAAGLTGVFYDTHVAFLAAAPGLSSGCILLDVLMPEIDRLAVQARLARLRKRFVVIVITGQGDVQTAVRAMKAGAVDFIEKPYDDEALVESIERALSMLECLDLDREAADAARRIATLSRREQQVLEALAAGQPNKVIAYNLGLSVRTVELHRARMMERLDVQQFADAIRLAVLARFAPDSFGERLHAATI